MGQSEFLSVAIEAAKQAEKVLRKYYSSSIKVEIKKDQTPVTIADKEAENVIIKAIRSKFPDHGFLGEETGKSDSDSEYVWVIDPIDGTKNYVRQIPNVGTLIALFKKEEPILGVSNMPFMNETIYAEKGRGAFANGKKIKVSGVEKLSDAYITFGGLNRFIKLKKEKGFLELIRSSKRQRAFGDVYNYHLVAQGKFDAVMEGELKVWDVAPFAVIMSEAGGKITDLEGKKIGFDSRTCVASNGKIHKEILGIINS